jgi:hypothetical protein
MSALAMQVSKKAIIPSAKWELCHWGCNPYIDPNISCICPVPESSGIQPAGCEQAGHVPEMVAVYKVDGLFD